MTAHRPHHVRAEPQRGERERRQCMLRTHRPNLRILDAGGDAVLRVTTSHGNPKTGPAGAWWSPAGTRGHTCSTITWLQGPIAGQTITTNRRILWRSFGVPTATKSAGLRNYSSIVTASAAEKQDDYCEIDGSTSPPFSDTNTGT